MRGTSVRQCPSSFVQGRYAVGYLKLAVTDRFAFMVSVMVFDLLVLAPDQPIHGEPASGVAVRVTTVPGA